MSGLLDGERILVDYAYRKIGESQSTARRMGAFDLDPIAQRTPSTTLLALGKLARRLEVRAGEAARYREALEAIASLDGDSMSDAGDAVDIARDALEAAGD